MTTSLGQLSWWGIRCVWLRYFDVFRKNAAMGVLTTFLEPFLFLGAFGFGLGGLVPDITVGGVTVTYRQFVLVGIVGQAILFQSFFESAYGSFVRMYYQRIFQAMAVTPITLAEVLWGELLWDATKATFASSVVLLTGVLLGDFSPTGALFFGIPLAFLGALLFSALGLWASAKSETIDSLSYPQYLLIFPMFLFCGVFFPLQQLPQFAQMLAWVFPLTSILSLLRSALLGFETHWFAPLILVAWSLVLIPFALRAMKARIIR